MFSRKAKEKKEKRKSKQPVTEEKSLGKPRYQLCWICFVCLLPHISDYISEHIIGDIVIIDDVIRDKDAERKKLEEEEQEFQQKKRERERKIIQIEKDELDRREDEVVS